MNTDRYVPSMTDIEIALDHLIGVELREQHAQFKLSQLKESIHFWKMVSAETALSMAELTGFLTTEDGEVGFRIFSAEYCEAYKFFPLSEAIDELVEEKDDVTFTRPLRNSLADALRKVDEWIGGV